MKIFLIAEKSKAKKIIEEKVITKSQLIELNKIKNFLETIKPGKILIDRKTCFYFLRKY